MTRVGSQRHSKKKVHLAGYFHSHSDILVICNSVLCLVSLVLSYSFVFMYIRVLKGVLSTYAYNVIYIAIILYPTKWVIFLLSRPINTQHIYIR